MNDKVILFGKINVGIVWLLVVLAVLLPDLIPFSQSLMMVGVFLVVAHIVEIIIFRKKLKQASDYVQTFFFGVFHIKSIK